MLTKYEHLSQKLKELLEANLTIGIEKLPTEAELCKKYQVSRQTVRKALALLEQEHLITKRQGSGAYATGLLPDSIKNQTALLLSSDTEYIYPSLIREIQNVLAGAGFSVAVYVTHNDISIERQILTGLLSHPPRGIIMEGSLSALPNPNFDLYFRLKEQNTAFVFLFGTYSNFPAETYVKDDNFQGGYDLASYLMGRQHTAIAALFQQDTLQGQERYLGMISALRDAGLSMTPQHTGWFSYEDLFALQKKQDTSFLVDFIHKKLTSCSAVICHNDEIAYWLIRELEQNDIHAPEDLSVVSFDGSYLRDFGHLSLTSLSHAPSEPGATAAKTLLNKLKGLPAVSASIGFELVPGESG